MWDSGLPSLTLLELIPKLPYHTKERLVTTTSAQMVNIQVLEAGTEIETDDNVILKPESVDINTPHNNCQILCHF